MREVIVQKAGGTSHATPEALNDTLGWSENSDISVMSAPGKTGDGPGEDKVTDMLLDGRTAYEKNGTVPKKTTNNITQRFHEITANLDGLDMPRGWVDGIQARVTEAINIGKEPASMLGERLMLEIYQGLGFTVLDPANSKHDLGAGRDPWRQWIQSEVKPGQKYALPGNTTLRGGELVTFGRGGSDISWGFAAYGMNADLAINLTDGPVSTADPRLITDGHTEAIVHLAYEEMRELGLNGTGIVHPGALVPLMIAGIPSHVRSTFDRSGPVTLLDNDHARAEKRAGLQMAVSLMKDVVMLNVYEPGMAEEPGRLLAYASALSGGDEARTIPIIDSKGNGFDGQKYFVNLKYAEEAAARLGLAVRNGGHVRSSGALDMVTTVGYKMGTRWFDNMFDLAFNSRLPGGGKRWQEQEGDISYGDHSLRISTDSASSSEVLNRIHHSIAETLRHQRRPLNA